MPQHRVGQRKTLQKAEQDDRHTALSRWRPPVPCPRGMLYHRWDSDLSNISPPPLPHPLRQVLSPGISQVQRTGDGRSRDDWVSHCAAAWSKDYPAVQNISLGLTTRSLGPLSQPGLTFSCTPRPLYIYKKKKRNCTQPCLEQLSVVNNKVWRDETRFRNSAVITIRKDEIDDPVMGNVYRLNVST